MSSYNEFVKEMMPQLNGTPQQRMKMIGQMWRERLPYEKSSRMTSEHRAGSGTGKTPKLKGGNVKRKQKKGKGMKNSSDDEVLFDAIFNDGISGGSIGPKTGAIVQRRKGPTSGKSVMLNNGLYINLDDLEGIYGLHGMAGGKAFKNTKFGHFLWKLGDTLKDHFSNPSNVIKDVAMVAPLLL